MTGHAHVARPKNPPHQRRRLSVIFSFSFFHLCLFTLSRLATIIYPFCQPKKEESNITRCVTSTSLYSSIWRGGIINVQQTHWIIHEMFFTYWEGRDVFFCFFCFLWRYVRNGRISFVKNNTSTRLAMCTYVLEMGTSLLNIIPGVFIFSRMKRRKKSGNFW
jgi:hypothetical protein